MKSKVHVLLPVLHLSLVRLSRIRKAAAATAGGITAALITHNPEKVFCFEVKEQGGWVGGRWGSGVAPTQ